MSCLHLDGKINIWRGLSFSRSFLWEACLRTDLTRRSTALDLPVCFLSGACDLTDNYGLSKGFFTQIKAPVKGFHSFANAARNPLFEEPGQSRTILTQDVLAQEARLSDQMARH